MKSIKWSLTHFTKSIYIKYSNNFLRSKIANLKIKGNLYHLVGRNNMGHLLVSNKQQVL